jgi:hypothetical protein
LKWIQKYIGGVYADWKIFFEEYLLAFGGPHLLLHCNYDLKELSSSVPTFYLELLKTWKHFYSLFKNQLENIFERIKINKKTVFSKKLMNASMWFITDLFNENNEPVPFETWEKRGVPRPLFFKWRALVYCDCVYICFCIFIILHPPPNSLYCPGNCNMGAVNGQQKHNKLSIIKKIKKGVF